MDNKILLIKIVIFGMIDGAISPTVADSLEVFVKILQIVFYSIGAYVLFTSAYDWHKNKKK